MNNTGMVRFAQNVFLVILSLSPFLMLEIGLRLFDYGYNPSLYIRDNETGMYVVNQKISNKFFTKNQRSVLPNVFEFDSFPIEKGPDVFRIFCFGGSTTAGDYPQLLQELLTKTAKNRQIEVINLGGVSLNSFQVEDFVEEMVDYQPDLFVLYMGHNEIYGPLGVASAVSGSYSYGLVNLISGMKSFRVFQLFQNGYQALLAEEIKASKGENAGLFKPFVNSAVAPDSELRAQSIDYFRRNLEKILGTAHQHQVPVMLSTVVSNIRHFKPFESEYPDKKTREAWDKLLNQAIIAKQRREFADSEKLFQEAIALFPNNARQYWELGQLYLRWQKFELAKKVLIKAKDLDVFPFRAISETNQVIRELASEYGVMLLDTEKIFESESSYGIIGKPIILDHLHPSHYGYYVIAANIAEQVYQQHLLEASVDIGFMSPEYKRMFDIRRNTGQFNMNQVWPFSINNADYRYP